MTDPSREVRAIAWRLAVDLVMGRLEPERAVRSAGDLVALGIENDAVIALAAMPSDVRQLRIDDVEPLARELVSGLRVQLPSFAEAGWATAAFTAEAMIEGALAPAAGASRIWRLWQQCDDREGVLVSMLQLTDDWDQSVDAERSRLERDMVAHASVVLEAAANHLGPDRE